jgi:hypothetical protein
MAISIENLFFYFLYFFDALVILQISFLFFKKRKIEIQLLLLMIYCVADSLINLISTYTTSYQVDYYLYGLFTLIEYCVFTFFIITNVRTKKFQKLVIYISAAFILFNIYHTIFSNHRGLDSIPIGIETILIFVYCFYYLYTQMNIVQDTFIYNKYQFWIIVGFMVYLGGSFFIYIFFNILDRKIVLEYWFLTYVFYIIKNILFAIGISLCGKEKQSKKISHNKVYPYLN